MRAFGAFADRSAPAPATSSQAISVFRRLRIADSPLSGPDAARAAHLSSIGAVRDRSAASAAYRKLLASAFSRVLLVHQDGLACALDHVLVDQHLADRGLRRDLVHDLEHRLLQDRTQPARARLVTHGLLGHRHQRALGELELDAVHLEQLLVLLDQRVLGLGQDVDQRFLVQLVQRRDHGQAAHELGDHAELEQVLGLHLFEKVPNLAILLGRHLGPEANRLLPDALLDDVLQPHERAAADEQDVGGVDLQELLLRVLAAALGRDVADGAFQDLEQRLLHALARDVAGDAGVVALACDLVDLVVGVLQQVDDDVLDVLAHVAGLGQVGGVRDREGHVEHTRQRLSEQGLAAAGGPEQKDVRFLQLHVVGAHLGVDALVVVVHRNRQDLLGPLLADHVFIEHGLDLGRLGHRRQAVRLFFLLDLFGDDVVAEADALVTDVDGRARDELLDFLLIFPAEGARKVAVFVALSIHAYFAPTSFFWTITSSMIPYSLASPGPMK